MKTNKHGLWRVMGAWCVVLGVMLGGIALPTEAAVVRFAATNVFGRADTNEVRVFPIGDPIVRADGSFITKGVPFKMANGTQTNLLQGSYFMTNSVLGRGMVFSVPDDNDTNTVYELGTLAVSGFYSNNYSPVVQQIVAGTNVTISPTSGKGVVTIHATGGGTSGGAPSGPAGGDLAGTYPNPTLAPVGTAGTYTKVTTDVKGRVTAGSSLVEADLPGEAVTEAELTLTLDSYATISGAETIAANAAFGDLEPDEIPAFNQLGTAITRSGIKIERDTDSGEAYGWNFGNKELVNVGGVQTTGPITSDGYMRAQGYLETGHVQLNGNIPPDLTVNGQAYFNASSGTVNFTAGNAHQSAVGVFWTPSSAITVTNTTAESSLFGDAIVIPAGVLRPGKTLEVTLRGVFWTGSTSTATFRQKIGDVTFSTGAVSTSGNQTQGRAFEWQFLITCYTSGPTGTVVASGHVTSVGIWGTANVNTAVPQTLDTTQPLALDSTVQWASTSGTSMRVLCGFVRILN